MGLLLTVAFSACNRVPDHARYIPSDALLVVGVNTKQLGREIAWSAITGSAVFDRLAAVSSTAGSTDAIRKLDSAGIRFGSTSYMYLRNDRRYDGDMRMTLLVPLQNEALWEAYVRRVFPGVEIRQRKDHKEILVEDEAVAGWNRKLLIVMNVIKVRQPEPVAGADSGSLAAERWNVVDTMQTSAEMVRAFAPVRENALTGNNRFIQLEKKACDISIWINYDAVMMQTMNTGGGMAAMGMASSLWKGTVMAAGINFEKGRVKGVVKYYVSEGLREIYKGFGSGKTDREMLDRVSPENLGLLAGWHLSTKGMKQLLDKTGLSGIAALGLMESGLTVDQVLQAFSGDMVVTLHDFRLSPGAGSQDLPDSVRTLSYEPEMDMVYALKIGRKDDFNRLTAFGVSRGFLTAAGENRFLLGGAGSGTVMLLDDKYAVISNNEDRARAWMQGGGKGRSLPDAAVKAVYGYPAGLFLDIQEASRAFSAQGASYGDSVMIAEGKKLLSYISFNSDPFEGEAYTSRIEIAFGDKNENSLLQLIDFALRMGDRKLAK